MGKRSWLRLRLYLGYLWLSGVLDKRVMAGKICGVQATVPGIDCASEIVSRGMCVSWIGSVSPSASGRVE